jgi:hypothetical protein
MWSRVSIRPRDYGFAFSESDLDQPLWKFSHNCTLSVAFVHTHIDEAKQAVERGAKSWHSSCWGRGTTTTNVAGATAPAPAKL